MLKSKHLLTLALALSVAFAATAQQRVSVTGRVVDSEGTPLAGASVIEKGTTNGDITNAGGNFSLSVSSSATLQVSFLGYLPVEIPAARATTSPIVMEVDATKIDDLVVIGYGTVRKSDLTGSVATLKAEELNRGAVTSASGLLQGKIPGLHIMPGDGGPGSKSTIRIRGSASLKATSDPLVVIDGLPLSRNKDNTPGLADPLSTLNPNDIESFTVLKDASSAAIYGVQGSNGVIMITTKKGTGKGLQISYNGSYSVSVNSKLVDVMSADEYRDYMFKTFAEDTDKGKEVRRMIGNSKTNWQKAIFRPAFATDQSVSLYGNVKKRMPYRLSLGYSDVNGTLKTSNYKRGTVDLSLSPTFFRDHLKVTLNARESYTANRFADGGAVGQAISFDPTQDIYFRDGDGKIDTSKANGWWGWMKDGATNNLATRNPLATLYDHFNRSNVNRLMGNVQIDYKLHFLPELRFNLNLGLDMIHSRGREGDRPGSFQSMSNTYAPGLGQTSHKKERTRKELLEFYIAYDKTVGKHHFDAMAGYSWDYSYRDNDNHTTNNDADNTLFKDYPLWLTESQLMSFFGRFNYGFGDRYLLTASIRADGSSHFTKENRWIYSPAVALAWNVKNEGFLRDNDRLSVLKLRVGWGRTPQDAISDNDYSHIPRYTQAVNPNTMYYVDGKWRSVMAPQAFNSSLAWEYVSTWNVGVDWAVLKGNLFGSLDLYRRATSRMLSEVSVPRGSTPSNKLILNTGNMMNKGVELALGANIFNRKDFSWTVGTNVTWQSTEITRLTRTPDPDFILEMGGIGGTGNNIQAHKVGYAPFTFRTYQQVWGPDGYPMQNVFIDRNGDGKITGDDRYMTGKKPAPDVFMGLNMKIAWLNWDFGFNSHGSFGNWLFNRFYSDHVSPPIDNITVGYLQNLSNTVKRSGFTERNAQGQTSTDMFLENASFFRMDDITLGYTFRRIFPRMATSSLRLAFTAQNPFVITRYSGLDPEVDGGIDGTIWPRPRIFSLRIALNF